MILFTKRNRRAEQETALLARAILLVDAIEANTKEQHKTNLLLSDLHNKTSEMVAVNKEFIEVIRHFFASEHNLKLEEIKKKAAREKELEPTKDDFRY